MNYILRQIYQVVSNTAPRPVGPLGQVRSLLCSRVFLSTTSLRGSLDTSKHYRTEPASEKLSDTRALTYAKERSPLYVLQTLCSPCLAISACARDIWAGNRSRAKVHLAQYSSVKNGGEDKGPSEGQRSCRGTSTRQSASCFVLSPKLILPRPINVQLLWRVKGGLIRAASHCFLSLGPLYQVKELILDNVRETSIVGLTDKFSSLATLSVIHVGLTSLDGLPALPSLTKVWVYRCTGVPEYGRVCLNYLVTR